MTATGPIARLARRGLCVVVAVALGLACAGFAIVMATAPTAEMAAMDNLSDRVVTADVSTTVSNTADLAAGLSPVAASLCDTVCAGSVNEVCMVAGGLTALMLLALLVAARRDTFLRLQPRQRDHIIRRSQRRRAPWALLSPIELCVLRV